MTYRILVVEDQKTVVDQYAQAFNDEEIEQDFEIVNATNKLDAEVCLEKENFDMAIMDLKVPQDSSDHEGNPNTGVALLKETLSKYTFPMIVVTATPGMLDTKSDNDLPRTLKIMAKEGSVYSDVAIYLKGMRSLLDIVPQFTSAKETLEKDFSSTFWNLYGYWEDFESKFQDVDRVPEVMKRHIAHYLVEKWTAEEGSGSLHHSEFYAYPPFRKKIYTGDIVDYEKKRWIVVTAPCDLSNNEEPDEITFLECVPVPYEHKKHKQIVKPFRVSTDDTGKQKSAKENLANFFTNQGISRHYLPSWSIGDCPHFIEFKKIKTIPYNTAKDLQVIASLNSHFMPNVMQRYGTYVSRLGQPEVNTEDYLSYLLTVVDINS